MNGYKPLSISQSGANKFLNTRKIDTLSAQLREYMGCWPGRISKASVDIVERYGINHIVISSNDGGLSDEDVKNLLISFGSSGKGHSEHGWGFRNAARDSCFNYIKNGKNPEANKFYIIDNSKGVSFKANINSVENEPSILAVVFSKEECSNVYNMFPSYLDNIEDTTTKMIIPLFFEKNKKESVEVIENIFKQTYHKQLLSNEVNLYVEKKEIKIKDNLSLTDTNKKTYYVYTWKKNKIIHNYNGNYFGTDGNMIELTDDDKGYLKKEIEVDISYKRLDDGYFPFLEKDTKKNTIYPSVIKRKDEREKIKNEYGYKKITDINGLFVTRGGVPISGEIVHIRGMYGRGTTSYHQYIFSSDCVNKIDNKKLYETRIQKNKPPELVNSFHNRMVSLYKHLKINTEKERQEKLSYYKIIPKKESEQKEDLDEEQKEEQGVPAKQETIEEEDIEEEEEEEDEEEDIEE